MGLTTIEDARAAILASVAIRPVSHSRILLTYGLPEDDTSFVLYEAAKHLQDEGGISIDNPDDIAKRGYRLNK